MNQHLSAPDNLQTVAQMMSVTADTFDAQQMLWSLKHLGLPHTTIGDLADMDEPTFYRVAAFVQDRYGQNPNRTISDAATNVRDCVSDLGGTIEDGWIHSGDYRLPFLDAVFAEITHPTDFVCDNRSWATGDFVEWQPLPVEA